MKKERERKMESGLLFNNKSAGKREKKKKKKEDLPFVMIMQFTN